LHYVDLHFDTILSHPFEQNAYVAKIGDRTDCVVIDPGVEPQKIVAYLKNHNLSPAAILNTHGHCDHIAGNAALKELWPECPVVIGIGDAPKLGDARLNLSADFGMPWVCPPADATVDDGDVYQAAGIEFNVFAIPGHTVGHVVFVVQASQPQVAFVGDVIFARSVGRTDFPDGSARQLSAGIRTKLFTLPDDTILLPGHGESTTVGEEKLYNPFVGQRARR
jgi:hydroxyacylglutathione hydrolase